MNIDRSLIRGDDLMPFFFCGHCKLLAVQPRIHSGGYEQEFCQTVFCQSCVAALQNFDFNRNYFLDSNGKRVARCPSGCRKAFCQPYFRPLDYVGRYHYDKIIIECPGCHTDFKADDFSTHGTLCARLRALRPWFSSVFVNSAIPRNNAISLQRRHWLELYESKLRIFSGINHSNNIRPPMSGDETLIRVFFPLGADKWEAKIVPSCIDKFQFLARVKEAFGLDNGTDGDVVSLTHRSLLSSPDVRAFLRGLPGGSPFTFFPKRKCFTDFTQFGSWLFLEAKDIKDFDPVPLVPASVYCIDEE